MKKIRQGLDTVIGWFRKTPPDDDVLITGTQCTKCGVMSWWFETPPMVCWYCEVEFVRV